MRLERPKLSSSNRNMKSRKALSVLLPIIIFLLCLWQWRMSALIRLSSQAESSTDALLLPSQAFCSRSKPPIVCAHGGDGDSGHPPNTRESFQAAIGLGVDCVEIDVARTKDGQLVVLHARELVELLKLPGNRAAAPRNPSHACDLSMDEISQLRWPKGETLLSVKEAIRMSSSYVELVILDIKLCHDGSDEDALVDDLIRTVHSLGCGNCLIWAKEDRIVRRLKKLSPGQKCGYICVNETEANRKEGMDESLRMREPEIVGMHFEMVSLHQSKIIQAASKILIVWTTNTAESMIRAFASSSDGVVTNHPRPAMRLIDNLMLKCGSSSKVGEL